MDDINKTTGEDIAYATAKAIVGSIPIAGAEYYKDFRKTIGDKGFKLETNAGNWSDDEVIRNIDSFLQKQNLN